MTSRSFSFENSIPFSVQRENLSSFQFNWASEAEKQWLHLQMKQLGRQRMNLHVMKNAKFILLKSTEMQIIGWGGLDIEFNPAYPELFSLHLDPAYRKFGLGLLIESLRATYLYRQNIKSAYVRMAKDTSYAFLMKRLESKFYRHLNSAELDSNYLNLCRQCDLFQADCRQQVFLKFDVEKFVQENPLEIGELDFTKLPVNFVLETPLLKAAPHPQDFANPTMKTSYKNSWSSSNDSSHNVSTS
jgi:hypothetical protein